jgi:hypothetical protein
MGFRSKFLMIERWADYLPSSTAGSDGLLRPMIPNCLQCSFTEMILLESAYKISRWKSSGGPSE